MNPSDIATTIIRQEAAALANLEHRLGESFDKVCEVIAAGHGLVVTTGIGKAGHMAEKFAATLCSTGTSSAFMHPAEASHGDLGLLGHGDLLIAISISGETREVIEAVRQARAAFDCETVVITAKRFSTLAREADHLLDLGDFEEACPLGLAPTTSMVMLLGLCDALALTVMQLNGFTREDFAARHHGGYLGQQARKHMRKVN